MTDPVDAKVPEQRDDVVDLRGANPASRRTVHVRGRAEAGDGGSGLWSYEPSSDAADNGIDVVKPASVEGFGRFLRFSSERSVHAAWFGLSADPAVDATSRLVEAIGFAVDAGKPLILDGGAYDDPSHGYTVSGTVRITSQGLMMRAARGFARLVQGDLSAGNLFEIGPDASTGAQYDLDHLYFVRNGRTSLRIVNAAKVRLGRIGGTGSGGGIISLSNCDDVAIDEIFGSDLHPENTAGLSVNHVAKRLRVGRVWIDNASEAVDIVGVEDCYIGSVHARNCAVACEVSSITRAHIESVIAEECGSAVQIKQERAGWETSQLHFGAVIARNFRTDPVKTAWNGVGIYATNEGGGAAGTYLDAHRRITFGTVSLVSSHVGSRGILMSSGGSRPVSNGVTFGKMSIRVHGQAVFVSRVDALDLGECRIECYNPPDSVVRLLDCGDGVRGDVQVRSPSPTQYAFRLARCASHGRLRLGQRRIRNQGTAAGYRVNGAAAAGAAAVAIDTGTGTLRHGDVVTFANHATVYRILGELSGPGTMTFEPALTAAVPDDTAVSPADGRPLGGLALEQMIEGRFEIDFEAIRGSSFVHAINLGTNASGLTTAARPLVLAVERAVCEAGQALRATGFAHLHVVGIDGRDAYLESATNIAAELERCDDLVLRAAVHNTTSLPSSANAALQIALSTRYDARVRVRGSFYKGVYLNVPGGGGRLEVSGGSVGTILLHVRFAGTWPNGREVLHLVGRGSNANGFNAGSYMYLLESLFAGALVGINADLAGSDSRAASLLNGLNVSSAEVTAFDACVFRLQFHRANTAIANESKINAAGCVYEKVTSPA